MILPLIGRSESNHIRSAVFVSSPAPNTVLFRSEDDRRFIVFFGGSLVSGSTFSIRVQGRSGRLVDVGTTDAGCPSLAEGRLQF
jgi:hypothetical protein